MDNVTIWLNCYADRDKGKWTYQMGKENLL